VRRGAPQRCDAPARRSNAMSQTANDGTNLLDPFGIWKQTRDTNLETWSKFMIDLVNSDEYSQATGQALSQALALSQPFRQALERTMTNTLQALNMPSRNELANLAQSAINVEFRLDDLDAKLSGLQKTLVANLTAAVQEAVQETVREVVQETVREVVQETVKDAVRQALTAPNRHLRDIEAHLVRVDAEIKALRDAFKEAPPAPAQPTAEQGQEG